MTPAGVIRPILLPPNSVNQRLPSGPTVRKRGAPIGVGMGNSVMVPAAGLPASIRASGAAASGVGIGEGASGPTAAPGAGIASSASRVSARESGRAGPASVTGSSKLFGAAQAAKAIRNQTGTGQGRNDIELSFSEVPDANAT